MEKKLKYLLIVLNVLFFALAACLFFDNSLLGDKSLPASFVLIVFGLVTFNAWMSKDLFKDKKS